MPGWFRPTKSKFQIFTIFSILSTSTSKFFQFCQIFQFSIFFLFLQILPLSLILVSSAGGGVFSKMIVRHTKILLLFQILTVIFSWDWSWEFDRSWSGPCQKFLKLENFRRYLQLGKELESYDSFNLNAQNFQILEKLRISSRTKKNLKSWKILVGQIL